MTCGDECPKIEVTVSAFHGDTEVASAISEVCIKHQLWKLVGGDDEILEEILKKTGIDKVDSEFVVVKY